MKDKKKLTRILHECRFGEVEVAIDPKSWYSPCLDTTRAHKKKSAQNKRFGGCKKRKVRNECLEKKHCECANGDVDSKLESCSFHNNGGIGELVRSIVDSETVEK